MLFPGAQGWIAAVILTMPIRQVSLIQLGGANLRIGDIVIALAVTAWLSFSLARGRVTWPAGRLDNAILLFVLVCGLSLIWSDQSVHGWIRVFKLARNLALYMMLVAFLKVGFTSGYRWIALCLLVAGLLQSAAFVVSMGQNGGTDAFREMASATSLLSNDPRLGVVKTEGGAGLFLRGAASWLPLCMFFALGVAHKMETRTATRAVWVSVLTLGLLTVLTLSRSAWLSLAVGVFAYLVVVGMRRSLRWVVVGTLGAGVVGLAGWWQGVINIVGNRMGVAVESIVGGRGMDHLLSDPALADRMGYFGLAFESFRRSPFLGGGVAGISPDEWITVHNVYLQVLGELGLLGVVVFGLVLWRWSGALVIVWRRSVGRRDSDLRRVAAAITGISVFFLIYFLAGHDLESSEPWIVMAATSALYSFSRAGRPRTTLSHEPLYRRG
jgi:O-antigen ligase